MIEPSFRREPMTRGERIGYWVSLAVILLLFGAEIVVNYEQRKLAAVFFLVSWLALVAVHEMGHALMAWMCGWGVRRVVIGFGRTVFQFRVGETRVEWRLFPIEGFVEPYPRDLTLPRAKDALIYAAGPGIELLAATLLTLILGAEVMFTLTDQLGILAIQAFASAAVTGAVLNLIPMSAESGGRQVSNDGLGILLAWRRPEADYRERMAAANDRSE